MATFKALNIESDDEEDIEVDNTKEIQIEDALKLYQAALRLHSEGPASYDQAADAYNALFNSDIFKYPESQHELKRIELYGLQLDQEDFYPVQEEHVVTSENAPSTLPQIIHLSYKNHGEFLLQSLQHKLSHSTADVQVINQHIIKASTAALNCFVEAIDKDDTDLDLWRRTAAVGHMLGSHRIARFCLEAVLDGDDQGLESVLTLPGISETLAGQQLRELVAKLQDELSLLQSPLSNMKRRQLSNILKQKLATYTVVQRYQNEHPLSHPSPEQALRSVLAYPASWQDLGDILYRQIQGEQNGNSPKLPGLGVFFRRTETSPAAEPIEIDHPSPRHVSPPPQHLSSLVDVQFPGMGDGQPVVPPILQENSEAPQDVTVPPSSATLPTRKRSSDAAGLKDVDAADGGRSRSKRIRARESMVDQSQIEDETMVESAQAEDELADFDYLDNELFTSLDELLTQIKFPLFQVSPNARKHYRDAAKRDDEREDNDDDDDNNDDENDQSASVRMACLDVYKFLDNFSNEQARVLLHANSDLDTTSDTQIKPSGRFSAAPISHVGDAFRPELDQHDGLDQFVDKVNSEFLHVHDVALTWVFRFLGANPGSSHPDTPSYLGHNWSQEFKALLVRMLVLMDAFFFENLEDKIRTWDRNFLTQTSVEASVELLETLAVIQTFFEVHVDVYSLVREPNSGVDEEDILHQGDRADRWANLARDAMNLRSSVLKEASLKDELNLRYLWTATYHISVSSDISQEHVISCWTELRAIFEAVGEPVLDLANNAVMPQMSIEAIDRELSRLTTQDFFAKVFDTEQDDFTIVIEGLEPLLEALHQQMRQDVESDDLMETDAENDTDYSASTPPELLNYLKNSNIATQISLWQRLREAYEGIEYQPMVICCYFRMIELLLLDIKSPAYAEKSLSERQSTLLKYVRLIKDFIAKMVHITALYGDSLACMDLERLHSAMASMVALQRLLHATTMLLDEVNVGIKPTPKSGNGLPLPSFQKVRDTFQDMQLQSWTLMYKLYRESLDQHKEIDDPNACLFEFLRAVHHTLGPRKLCGKSNRIFLKLAKVEVLRFRNETKEQNDDFDLEFAQILYDLFGLKCFLNPTYALKEHHCMHDAFVDKTSAMQAVDLLLNLASRIKMSELPKHSLKDTIEKVHGIIVRKKPTEGILRNRDVYRAYLKSHINPVDLYKSLRGEGELTLTPVSPDQAILASKGWYFLMGHIALSKFRAQKRLGPAATEDVDIAVAFFMQDLEYSMDNWETWFRLAQAYDAKIEEAVSWSADKLNSNMSELVQQQRSAIHCYSMAIALAMRSAEPGTETQAKLGELYAGFAMRMYSSSREPFGMRAFANDDIERFLSKSTIMKVPPFKSMAPFSVWKFAREMFRRAIKITPNRWMLHFYLGKCLWKMYCNAPNTRDQPSLDAVINEFCESINLLPRKKDSKREPILEPHYKLASVVHKMVTRRFVDPTEGCNILIATPYAAKVDPVADQESWEPYILKVLKNLRTADKVHWHHRMIYRTAKILYRDGTEKAHCIAAKDEFMKQMFTKTMMMNVWKPENERAGRHFVYTSRYADMFIRILEFLEDRPMLDALARRIRKKSAEFFEHGALWQYLCTAYLKVLRRHGQVPLAHETAVFSGINHEDFLRRKDYLEKWCKQPENAKHPVMETLQDVIELKKINSTLMKAAPIDDLIGDAYAYLYDTIGRKLWTAQEAKDEEKKTQEEAIKTAEQTATSTPVPERNPMMNLSHLMNIDGATEAATKPPPLPLAQSVAEGTATPPTTDSAPAQSRRKVGVGRREVRLCAEACVSQIGATATPAKSNNEIARPRTEVSVVIEARRPSAKGTDMANTSADGSIQDDADDESDSELSDVDEELVNGGLPANHGKPKVTFPGLISARTVESYPPSHDDDDDGEEEDDVEEGAGGDEVENEDHHEAEGEEGDGEEIGEEIEEDGDENGGDGEEHDEGEGEQDDVEEGHDDEGEDEDEEMDGEDTNMEEPAEREGRLERYWIT